jgi:hypothetical protein
MYLPVHRRSPELSALFAFFPWVWRMVSERTMAGNLQPLEVARLVTPGKYPDGDGLYLVVAGATSRNWSCRYWINRKRPGADRKKNVPNRAGANRKRMAARRVQPGSV